MTEKFTKTEERIASALEKKGSILPCPRCGSSHLGVIDGYYSLSATNSPGQITMGGGKTSTLVAEFCFNCGYIALHVLNVLES
jgi:ribosomal protein S27AE